MNVVNAIAKDDVIKKSTTEKLSLMLKVFSDYFLNKWKMLKNKLEIEIRESERKASIEKNASVVASKGLFL
jgi:hypothetical protein